MEILSYSNSQAYVFPNDNSDKLIIVLEGSGWSSVLGTKKNDAWTAVYYGYHFLQELNESYTFLIPEILQRQPGGFYIADIEDRANRTAENLIASYTGSINSFLQEHEFSSIVILSIAEGAMLLPIIYENMNDKDNVTAMVSIGFGGLSMNESYNILSKRTDLPQGYFEPYFNIPKIFTPSNSGLFDSYEEDYYGFSFRWLSSIVNIRPYEYYENIHIPILFVHEENDYVIPVESTQYIQKNLPEKPFEYKYYPHQIETYDDLLQFRKDISEWIRKKTL